MAIKATVFLLFCIVAMSAAAPRRKFGSKLDQYQNGFRYKRCITEDFPCKKDSDCCGYEGEGAGNQCFNPDTYVLARINPDGATCGPNQSGGLERR